MFSHPLTPHSRCKTHARKFALRAVCAVAINQLENSFCLNVGLLQLNICIWKSVNEYTVTSRLPFPISAGKDGRIQGKPFEISFWKSPRAPKIFNLRKNFIRKKDSFSVGFRNFYSDLEKFIKKKIFPDLFYFFPTLGAWNKKKRWRHSAARRSTENKKKN